VPDWSGQEKLVKEKEFIGFYITGHPLKIYSSIVQLYSTDFNAVNGSATGSNGIVNICGMITEMRTLLDKKQNKMAFVKVEDFNRTYEAVVFGSVFSELESKLEKDSMVLLSGRLNSQPDDPMIKIICENAFRLEDAPVKMTEALILRINKPDLDDKKITYLKNILNTNRGNIPVYFKVSLNGKEEINMVAKKVRVNVNTGLLTELEKLLSLENIKVQVKKL